MPRRRTALDVPIGVHRIAALLATGTTRDAVDREVALGRWQRPARGVVVTHDRPLTVDESAAVARAYAGPAAVLTGATVLREVGARWVPPGGPVHVLVPAEQHTRSSGIVRVTRTHDLASLDTWYRWHGPVAPAERAVYDAARTAAGLRDARGLVLAAVADGWASPEGLSVLVSRGRRNGSAHVRRAVHDAARGCASPPEAELTDALLGRGLPFLVNPAVSVRGVLIGYPDVWAVGLGCAGEVQSLERHGSPADEESTYDRHERFTDAGLTVVHLSVRRIRRDAREAADHFLRRARERRSLPPDRREPAGLEVRPRGPLLR